jgi:O-acetylhomoserine/O-acetylserine sulfhydrylase-like pyridoxal-dependent enzyme
LGEGAGNNLTTGDNNIDIGNGGFAAEGNTIRIGALQTTTFIAGIHGVAVTGSAVVVNSSGQLGVAPSSERFKEQIKPMDRASEAILALKPVTFHYKHELDPESIPQFGLVAEQVEKVNPDLVVRDAEGKVFTVRYEAVNAMLLNEFLKEHKKIEEQERKLSEQDRKVQEQETSIAQLKKGMEVLTAQLHEQASQIQKVSAQLELSKTAPRTVVSN